MERSIVLNDQSVSYTLRPSPRARRVRLSVYTDGRVVVTVPRRFSERIVEQFLREKAEWLHKHRSYFASIPRSPVSHFGPADYRTHKGAARALINERITFFNRRYRYSFRNISVRNQKSCWGSCTGKRNLNFNYKILFLPEHVRDYVIVHELCHLKEMNHSKRFWNLVAHTFPYHQALRRELKQFDVILG